MPPIFPFGNPKKHDYSSWSDKVARRSNPPPAKWAAVILVVTIWHSHTTDAACIGQRMSPPGDTASLFGTTVAAGPDYIAVGVPGDSQNGANAGAVELFTMIGGQPVPTGTLRAGDSGPSSYFGSALASSGEIMLVGAPWDDDLGAFAGAAYVFVRSEGVWIEVAKLHAPDGVAQDFFGGVVALNGPMAAVTAIGQDAGANGASAVYAYTKTGETWSFATKLIDPQPQVGGRFGHSLAIGEDRVVVGSNVSERVYVYSGSGNSWSLEQTLAAVNPPPGETGFGTGLAMHGAHLAISAIHWNTHAGTIFHFKRSNNNWAFLERLDAPDQAPLGHFGWHLAMHDSYLAVGAVFTRKAFLYQKIGDTWRYEKELRSDTPAVDDGFGSVVAVGDFGFVAGAPDDPDGIGAAYAFEIQNCVTAIPAMSVSGLVALTILLGGAGSWVVNRRS